MCCHIKPAYVCWLRWVSLTSRIKFQGVELGSSVLINDAQNLAHLERAL